jgi:predicted nucleotide-binding protein (sugar kinase/HSP70/actin superfamily)
MVITFPHMGNTFLAAKVLFDDLGVSYIIPSSNNKKTLEIGTKYAPELACLPLKLNIGNCLEAYEKGADTLLITGGCGPCRFGYFSEMLREILKDIGCEMDIIALEMPDKGFKELLSRIKKLSNTLNPFKLTKVFKDTTIVSIMIDELEKLARKNRAIEKIKGETDKIYNGFLKDAPKIKGSAAMKRFIQKTENRLKALEFEYDVKPLRIGIVGEIYSTNDPFTNLYIEQKLGNMGIDVDRNITVSGWIVEHMIKKALHLPRDNSFEGEAKPYLGAMIGGHAQETVGNAVLYAKNGYDGVIQIYPLTCMPEIVAQSILPSVQKDFDIPILTLIIDEHSAEAGYLTRIEAFVDLLSKRREKRKSGNDFMLSWG